MKKILLILLFAFSNAIIYAQCKEFTNQTVIPKLNDYLPTGKYHAMTLREGEEILIFKTLNKGIKYRFVVMSDASIPQPIFKIVDWENNLIFDNQKNQNTNTFDYNCPLTQRIKIVIAIPVSSNNSQNIKSGCVSMVIGIK